MLFERSANPIILIDEQRRFVDLNVSFCDVMGYTRGGLIGRSITEFIKDGEKAESWERWRQFLQSGEYSGRRTFVRSDGHETEVEFAARLAVVDGRRLAVGDDAEAPLQQQRDENRQWVEETLAEARAQPPESDLLQALRVAADSIRDLRGHRSITIVDSGLSTAGALDFTSPDLLDAVPREITDALGEAGALPDLSGMSVQFVGLGATAAPQQELGRIRQAQLEALWTTIAETAGASLVELEPLPASGEPTGDLPDVSPVPVPPGYDCQGNVMTITGGALSFHPYTDNWFDPATAESILRPIADQVKAGQYTALLEGYVADVRDESEQNMLSYLQAQAIADMWLTFDVPVQQLTVVGRASTHPDRLPEVTPAGDFDPIAAESTRRIVLTFSGPATCG